MSESLLFAGRVVKLPTLVVRLIRQEGACWVCQRGRQLSPGAKEIRVAVKQLEEAVADELAAGVAREAGYEKEAYGYRFHAKDRRRECPDDLHEGLQWLREKGRF